MRHIETPDPTKGKVLPIETAQAEAVNDFLPPAPDAFDVNLVEVRKEKQPAKEETEEHEARAAGHLKPRASRRPKGTSYLKLQVSGKKDSSRQVHPDATPASAAGTRSKRSPGGHQEEFG